jgi:hypothetical protein
MSVETIPYELIHQILFLSETPKDYVNFLLSSKFVGEKLTEKFKSDIRKSFVKEKKLCFRKPHSKVMFKIIFKYRYSVLPNGRKEGMFKKTTQGRKIKKGLYIDGKKEGLWKTCICGVPKRGGFFKDGKKIGVWKYWGYDYDFLISRHDIDFDEWWKGEYGKLKNFVSVLEINYDP